MHEQIENNKGSALLLVLIIGFIVLTIGMVSTISMEDNSKKIKERKSSLQVFNIAEAGKERGLAKLRSKEATPPDTSEMETLVESTPFSNGSYLVTCSTVACRDSSKIDTFLIKSIGSYQSESKSIMVRCVNAVTNPYDTCEVFKYMLYSGGTMKWAGNGGMDSGKVHCNNDFSMSGTGHIKGDLTTCTKITLNGKDTILGNVTAPTTPQINGKGYISGTKTCGPVPSISVPNIDFNALYYNHALSNGQIFTGNKIITGSTDVTIPGGILWVNGTFKKSGSGKFTGCVIATGDIDISGSGNCTNVGDFPFAVSVNGDISWSGTGDITMTGLIYAMNGQFKHSGGGNLTLTGQVIAKNGFDKSGGGDFFVTYKKQVPTSVSGGSTSSSFTVLDWREL